MASEAAWGQAREIVEALDLRRKLDAETLDNLKGRLAVACDKAWQQGFDDCEMRDRLTRMGLKVP